MNVRAILAGLVIGLGLVIYNEWRHWGDLALALKMMALKISTDGDYTILLILAIVGTAVFIAAIKNEVSTSKHRDVDG